MLWLYFDSEKRYFILLSLLVIPVFSCFAGFPSCARSFQPFGIMLPSGICQVLPASQWAVKLHWHGCISGRL